MLTLTLDTNVLKDVNEEDSGTTACPKPVKALIELARTGHVDLALTTVVSREVLDDRETSRSSRMREWMRTLPLSSAAPAVARFGYSRFDGGDVFGGEADVDRLERLRAAVFPTLASSDPGAHRNTRSGVNDIVT